MNQQSELTSSTAALRCAGWTAAEVDRLTRFRQIFIQKGLDQAVLDTGPWSSSHWFVITDRLTEGM